MSSSRVGLEGPFGIFLEGFYEDCLMDRCSFDLNSATADLNISMELS